MNALASKQMSVQLQIGRILFVMLVVTALLLICTSALATVTPPDPAAFPGSSGGGFYKFFQGVQYALSDILNSPDLTNFTLVLWKFFAVISIVWLMVMYAMNGVTFPEIFTLIFMLLITRALMNQYGTLTTAMWGWSEGFAGGLQKAVTGGNGDIFWLSRYIWNACTSISFGVTTLLHPMQLITIAIANGIVAILVLLGTFATVWALWGYALAKMIGFMFIPFILFDKLTWLFDGWLRFFIGFLLYNVIARANLILVVVALQEFFNLPTKSIPVHTAMTFGVSSFTGMLGLLAFLLIGVIALISTGGFVKAIISGSHMGPASGMRSAVGAAATAVAAIL